MPEPATFINCFAVTPDRDDAFLQYWESINSYMATQPGYLDHKLHRALAPDAEYRFINVVHWTSPETWAAAHNEGFQRLLSQPGAAEFPPHPALCEVIHSGAADGR